MSKKNNVIQINGHRYNAATGESLTATTDSGVAVHVTVKQSIPRDPYHKQQRAGRPASRHHAPHPTAPPRTLMRQAVKKPQPAAKRRLKAQGHTDTLAKASLSTVTIKQSALQLDKKRLQHAKRIPRSQHISRFSWPVATSNHYVLMSTESWTDVPAATAAHAQPNRSQPADSPYNRSDATDEMLERALQRATSHLEPPATKHHRFRLRRQAA